MITLEKIQYRYQGSEKIILRDLDLTLPPGLFTSLIGPNGSGKSTLLRLAAGLERPLAGTIRLDGKPYDLLTPASRARQFAFMDADPLLTVPMKVSEFLNLSQLARPEGPPPDFLPEEYFNWILDRLCLAPFLDKNILTLSSGERQRCFLALALLQKTGYVFLDEPVSHMDPGFAFRSLEALKSLVGAGLGVIVVLHDIQQVRAFSDLVFVIQSGELLFQGKPDRVLTADNLNRVFETDNYFACPGPDGAALVFQGRSPSHGATPEKNK